MGRPRKLKDRNCFNCGKLYRPFNSLRKYCSFECSLRKRPHRGKILICKFCSKQVYKYPWWIKTYKIPFCSKKCSNKGLERGGKIILYCKKCKKRYKTFRSHVKWRGSSFCSRVCMGKWKSESQQGANNNLWKGGISKPLRRLRASKKWKIWRERVFERDNYTCQNCEKRETFLHPHHIKLFAKYPKLRFEVSNGKTLCINCHKIIHGKKTFSNSRASG